MTAPKFELEPLVALRRNFFSQIFGGVLNILPRSFIDLLKKLSKKIDPFLDPPGTFLAKFWGYRGELG